MLGKKKRYKDSIASIKWYSFGPSHMIHFYKNYPYDVSFVEKTRALRNKTKVHRSYDTRADGHIRFDSDDLAYRVGENQLTQMLFKGELIHTFKETDDRDLTYTVDATHNHLHIQSSQGSDVWYITRYGTIKHIVLTDSPLTETVGKWCEGLYDDTRKAIRWSDFEPTHYLLYHLSNGSTVSEIFFEEYDAEARLAGVKMVLAKRKPSKRREDLLLTIDPPERLFKHVVESTTLPLSAIVSVEYGQH